MLFRSTGNIVLEPVNKQCRQIIFNNDNGNMAEIMKQCKNEEAAVLDENGAPPIPQVVKRRLESLRRSFTNTK